MMKPESSQVVRITTAPDCFSSIRRTPSRNVSLSELPFAGVNVRWYPPAVSQISESARRLPTKVLLAMTPVPSQASSTRCPSAVHVSDLRSNLPA